MSQGAKSVLYISYEGLPGKEVLCVQLPGFIDHRFNVVKAKSGWKFFVQSTAGKFPARSHPDRCMGRGSTQAQYGRGLHRSSVKEKPSINSVDFGFVKPMFRFCGE